MGQRENNSKKGEKKILPQQIKLSKQLDEIVEAVKSRGSYIRTDPPGCSGQEVLDKLTMLHGMSTNESTIQVRN